MKRLAELTKSTLRGRAQNAFCDTPSGFERASHSSRGDITQAILSRIVSRTCFMPKPVPLPPPGFDELSVDEKDRLPAVAVDRIAATPETIPVSDWHREILD